MLWGRITKSHSHYIMWTPNDWFWKLSFNTFECSQFQFYVTFQGPILPAFCKEQSLTTYFVYSYVHLAGHNLGHSHSWTNLWCWHTRSLEGTDCSHTHPHLQNNMKTWHGPSIRRFSSQSNHMTCSHFNFNMCNVMNSATLQWILQLFLPGLSVFVDEMEFPWVSSHMHKQNAAFTTVHKQVKAALLLSWPFSLHYNNYRSKHFST